MLDTFHDTRVILDATFFDKYIYIGYTNKLHSDRHEWLCMSTQVPIYHLHLQGNKINERGPLKMIFNFWNHIQFLISSGSLITFSLLVLATHDIVWGFGIFSIPEQVTGPYIHLGELGQL